MCGGSVCERVGVKIMYRIVGNFCGVKNSFNSKNGGIYIRE